MVFMYWVGSRLQMFLLLRRDG